MCENCYRRLVNIYSTSLQRSLGIKKQNNNVLQSMMLFDIICKSQLQITLKYSLKQVGSRLNRLKLRVSYTK